MYHLYNMSNVLWLISGQVVVYFSVVLKCCPELYTKCVTNIPALIPVTLQLPDFSTIRRTSSSVNYLIIKLIIKLYHHNICR